MYGQQWRKLQNLVDFPIRNLDMSGFSCYGSSPDGQKFLREELKVDAPLYDLHGMVNHYGTLGFGHYVSYTKNHFDEKWYRYDDLYREEVSEDQLHKASAYLLFYVRKDIALKNLAQVMPDIEREYFPGKPVKL